MTLEQALTCREFHLGDCTEKPVYRVRRSGKTQTWKRSPERFKIPVMHGLWEHGYITEENMDQWHCAEDCPKENIDKTQEMAEIQEDWENKRKGN